MKNPQKRIFIPSILKIGKGELSNLGQYLKSEEFSNVACFFSAGMEDIVGDIFYKSLKSKNIKVLHKDTIDQIHIENVIHTAFRIPKNIDALVGIGGGKALDYSKYCAFVLDLPFISIPTSISNDGFCSPNSALLVENKRQTIKAKIPYGVIVDLGVLLTSPDSCIYSGIGDLISKVTASFDWKMAAEKGYETFNDFANLIAYNTVTDVMSHQTFGVKSSVFQYHLANSLLMNGLSMEIAGSSRPASGSEHLISHAYDAVASSPAMHGIQVGVATYLCSYLQNNQHDAVRNFLAVTGFFDFVLNYRLSKNDFIEAIKLAPTIKENFYTILSVEGKIQEAINFVNSDSIMLNLFD